jgi:hypothetical protein
VEEKLIRNEEVVFDDEEVRQAAHRLTLVMAHRNDRLQPELPTQLGRWMA